MAHLIASPILTNNVKTITPIQVDNSKKTLTICDHKSGKHYLVHSGAEVSCISASSRDKRLLSPSTPLVAANGSKITTWGKRNQVIHLGPHSYTWSFYIAEVGNSLLGADFLVANDLAIDLRGRHLIDLSNYASVPTRATASETQGIHEVRTDNPDLSTIINEFPDLMIPRFKETDDN